MTNNQHSNLIGLSRMLRVRWASGNRVYDRTSRPLSIQVRETVQHTWVYWPIQDSLRLDWRRIV